MDKRSSKNEGLSAFDAILEKYSKDERYNNKPDSVEYEVNNLYSIRSKFGRYFESEKMYYLVELLNHDKISLVDKKVLDVGCHTGWILNLIAFLKESSDDLTGIDIVDEYIERANCINNSINFKTENILESEGGEKYNLILLIYILSEIYPAKARLQFANKIASLQDRGDYLIIFNFKRLPKLLFLLLKIARPFCLVLKIKIPSPEIGYERNLDDSSVKSLFKDYELVKSYSFITLFARKLIHDYKVPVAVARIFSKVVPKYYMALLKKNKEDFSR